jgi:GntR family transcriptional regulator
VSPRGRKLGERLRLRSGSDAPAHVQIEEQLAERIASGELQAGERLPPERDLARDLNVSRMTVRQALSSLAGRGLVERGVGRGTFVANRKVDHDLTRVAGFSEQLARQGLEPGAKIIDVSEVPAGWRISAALEIAPKAPVVRIQRLRLADGVPMALEDSWFPAEHFPGFADHDLHGSLYALMRDVYGAAPVRAIERLEPVLARAHEARALDIPARAPLMLVERTAYDGDGTPVEFAHDRYRGDRARFVVRVSPDVLAHA